MYSYFGVSWDTKRSSLRFIVWIRTDCSETLFFIGRPLLHAMRMVSQKHASQQHCNPCFYFTSFLPWEAEKFSLRDDRSSSRDQILLQRALEMCKTKKQLYTLSSHIIQKNPNERESLAYLPHEFSQNTLHPRPLKDQSNELDQVFVPKITAST